MSPSTNAFSYSFLSNSRQNPNLDHQADGAKENDTKNQTYKRVAQPEERANSFARKQGVAINQGDPDTTDRSAVNRNLDMWLNFELLEINYIEGSGTIPVLTEPKLPYDPELWDSWLDWAAGESPREFRIARDDYIYAFESAYDQGSGDGSDSEQSTLCLTPDAINENNVRETGESKFWSEHSSGGGNYHNTGLHRIRTPLVGCLSKQQQPPGPSSPLSLTTSNVRNVRKSTETNYYWKYPLGTIDNDASSHVGSAPQTSIQVLDEQPECIESRSQDTTPQEQLRSVKGSTILPGSIAITAKALPQSHQTSIVTDAHKSVSTVHITYSISVPPQNRKRKRTDDCATPLCQPTLSPRKSRGRAPHTNLPTNKLPTPPPTPSLLLPTWRTIPANDQRRNPTFCPYAEKIFQCVYTGPAIGQGGCGMLVPLEHLNSHLAIHAQMEESMVLASLLNVNKVHALLWVKKVPFQCSVTGCGFYTEAWQSDGVKERHDMECHPSF